jgi:hypothetical protein
MNLIHQTKWLTEHTITLVVDDLLLVEVLGNFSEKEGIGTSGLLSLRL